MTPESRRAADMANQVETKRPEIADYELLRRIGQGAYGEVWLGRGLTGAYRAVKVVWRDRFQEAEPFHREFRGVKESMAGATDAGQLALLHVGQNEAAGFFYYVMELADDTTGGRNIDPSRYVPLTLKELKTKRGRLPARECIDLAVALARALNGLHSRGLVHRDIKPSNIILVNGAPKLADVGLVAASTDARTLVGTQGYMPPEGPGSPGADVFALGKVVYELATGLDRDEFPRLPAELSGAADREALFELNEVLLRACEPLPEKRYRNGGAMLEDLVALQGGRSLRRRRHGRLVWGGIVVAAVTLAGIGFWWQGSRQPSAASTTKAPVAAEKSIAVLPFENLTNDRENGYLADGIQEDVVTDLAGLRGLKVISRASVARYRGTTKPISQIGAELAVAFILNGSIRREGNRIRLSAQLVEVRTDEQVWARNFDREMSGMLALQSDLAGEIVPALQLTLSPGEKAALAKSSTASVAAYDLYLQARKLLEEHIYEEGVGERAEGLLRRAVATDPEFVRAWVALAEVHRLRYFGDRSDPTDARIAMAEQAIEAARRLAPDSPEVLMGLGQIRHYCYKDYPGAIALYHKVLAAYPNYPEAHVYLGNLYRRLGRWPDALVEYREAVREEPGNVARLGMLFYVYVAGHRSKEAVEMRRQILRFYPDSMGAKFALAYATFIHLGGSEAELERWLAEIPANERENQEVIDCRFGWAVGTGNEPMLMELIRKYGLGPGSIDGAAMLQYRGEHQLLEQQLDRWKPELDHRMKTAPTSAGTWTFRAKYFALRGDKAETLAAVDRARQLMPEAEDAMNGPMVATELTKALAWVGEKDAALAEIKRLVRVPVAIQIWQLKYSICWLPVRDDPRLQAIVDDPKNREPLF